MREGSRGVFKILYSVRVKDGRSVGECLENHDFGDYLLFFVCRMQDFDFVALELISLFTFVDWVDFSSNYRVKKEIRYSNTVDLIDSSHELHA